MSTVSCLSCAMWSARIAHTTHGDSSDDIQTAPSNIVTARSPGRARPEAIWRIGDGCLATRLRKSSRPGRKGVRLMGLLSAVACHMKVGMRETEGSLFLGRGHKEKKKRQQKGGGTTMG